VSVSLETHDFIIRNTTKPEEVVLLSHDVRKLDTSLLCQWLSLAKLPHPTCNWARRDSL